MFKVNTRPTFTRTVTVHVPHGEGFVEETFKATFCLLDSEDSAPERFTDEDGQRLFLEQAIVSLEDIADEDGKVIPYDTAVRDAVIRRLDARSALTRAYYAALGEAQAGNFAGPPAPGQRAGS